MADFFDICAKLDLFTENFGEKDVNLAFNLSKMTDIDEISNDKIFMMQFIEFFEAMARIADTISLPKVSNEF